VADVIGTPTGPLSTLVLALLPGDPLASAARRAQDQLASLGHLEAQALPPLVPIAIRGSLSPAARRLGLEIVSNSISTGRLQVQPRASWGAGMVVLGLEQRDEFEMASRDIGGALPSVALPAAPLATRLLPGAGRSPGVLLMPAGTAEPHTVALDPLQGNECRATRWHAAVLAVTFSRDGDGRAVSWTWEILATRKLRRQAAAGHPAQ
jgi:hypothetical protein